jgi:hypothetical protein
MLKALKYFIQHNPDYGKLDGIQDLISPQEKNCKIKPMMWGGEDRITD